MRQYCVPVSTAFCLLASCLLTSPSAFANIQDTRNVAFSELTMQDGSSDNSICLERYGNGYTISPSKDAPKRSYVSDKGHTITLVDRSEIMGQGIFAEHDRFMMTFPKEQDEEIEVTQFVTGFAGGESYSGVFTDGTCTGKVTVGPWSLH
ncbi:hypothetical protein PsAD2_00323 [Pseudovibrio axinellae]|uniref:Uncharacterized protein n=2 Tax=Pseudovibrio axinellae TaxID=989403 RepID=A0A166B516_9HYPH|nr:hypothetical protein PsAD2_00323 [Pseudovibrio axinellae]SEQ82733.1 hypothetical protein SAMN05421798_104321 [Pseudovibrio axinellae]